MLGNYAEKSTMNGSHSLKARRRVTLTSMKCFDGISNILREGRENTDNWYENKVADGCVLEMYSQ